MDAPDLSRPLTLSDIARALGMSVQTAHTWRRRCMLPKFREREDEDSYGLGEMLAHEIMRRLTNDLPALSATSAAAVACMCAGRFWALGGRIPRGSLFALEPGHYQRMLRFVTADELPAVIKDWMTQPDRARLELIDLRDIGLRVGAKLARYQDPELRERSEEEVIALIEPFFEDKVSQYIEKEMEKNSQIATEKMKRYA